MEEAAVSQMWARRRRRDGPHQDEMTAPDAGPEEPGPG